MTSQAPPLRQSRDAFGGQLRIKKVKTVLQNYKYATPWIKCSFYEHIETYKAVTISGLLINLIVKFT